MGKQRTSDSLMTEISARLDSQLHAGKMKGASRSALGA